ncbi:cilia- and flagella-associated protein 300 isoform X4 [Daktulosphaira vitifoliae]|nr:cilia- and flagella-associated protein 300 isoform X4 [Daktulosphaira vitifoliae]
MKKCLQITYYAFNQEFSDSDVNQFILDFFQDKNVTCLLQTSPNILLDCEITRVKVEEISCVITSMDFFDKLLNPINNIVSHGKDREGNTLIRQCEEVSKNGIYITNVLKKVLLDDECEEYSLYNSEEREEFIFKLLTHFVIGGTWCQDDVTIEPYLNTTKNIYKDLISVEKNLEFNKILVASKVYNVMAFNSKDDMVYPKGFTDHFQNSFVYLIINRKTRTVTLFAHNAGNTIYT